MMKCLLDTNVLLDFLADRDGAGEAEDVLLKGYLGECVCFVDAKSILDCHYVLKHYFHDEQTVRRKISVLLDAVVLLDTRAESIRDSLKLPMNDYEDGVLSLDAEASGIDFIVTRNIKDFDHSPVKAISPNECLRFLRGEVG